MFNLKLRPVHFMKLKGYPVPLPEWFQKGSVCKLTSGSMLVNFYRNEVSAKVLNSI